MKEGGRGHELDIYLGPTVGEAMVPGGGRLHGLGSTALWNMQEQKKSIIIIIESAGELKVVRDMRGNGER